MSALLPYRPILKLCIFTFILAGLIFLLDQIGVDILHSHIWYMLAFFFGLTLLTMVVVLKSTDPKTYVVFYLSTVVARLLLSVMAAFVFFYFLRGQEVPFVINFFSFYLLFLLFEIITLLSNLRAGNEKPD
ncbi:MAG: hypothetical protein ACR2MX_14595 [Cyclobacteriaceae bacterium]